MQSNDPNVGGQRWAPDRATVDRLGELLRAGARQAADDAVAT